MQVPVVTRTSQATRPIGSSFSTASRTASEIWSAILSGCPSVTDSEVKMCRSLAAKSASRCCQFNLTRVAFSGSITVMVWFIRPFHGDAKIFGLLRIERGELDADFFQVQARHFFIQLLGQRVNAHLVLVPVSPKVELSQGLVGEAVAHHEAGVAGGATEIDQAAF